MQIDIIDKTVDFFVGLASGIVLSVIVWVLGKGYGYYKDKKSFRERIKEVDNELSRNLKKVIELRDFLTVTKINDAFTWTHSEEIVNSFSKDNYDRLINSDLYRLLKSDAKQALADTYLSLRELVNKVKTSKEEHKEILGKYAPPDAYTRDLVNQSLRASYDTLQLIEKTRALLKVK